MSLQALAMFLYVRGHAHYRPFRLLARWDAPDPTEIRRLLRIGAPIAGTLFVEASLFIAASLLIGRLGPTLTAGHLVAINYSALVFMIPLGLGSAAAATRATSIATPSPLMKGRSSHQTSSRHDGRNVAWSSTIGG